MGEIQNNDTTSDLPTAEEETHASGGPNGTTETNNDEREPRGRERPESVLAEAPAIIETLHTARLAALSFRKKLADTLTKIDGELALAGVEVDRRPAASMAAAAAARLALPTRPMVPKPIARTRYERAKPAAKASSKASLDRLQRRTEEDIHEALEKVVSLVKKHPGDGLRSEHIQKHLHMDPREMPRILKEGVDRKLLRKTGEKRATLYTAR
jgi:hypothetical protein